MVRIAICDDEESVVRMMERILEKCTEELKTQVEIEAFYDGQNLIDYLSKTGDMYDLVFLDIEMNRMDGLETAEKLREMDQKLLIVYVTSHESYALRAYQVHPYDFLVKPIEEKTVRKCFNDAFEVLMTGEKYYHYTYKKTAYRIMICDIMYFMSDKRMVQIYMKDGTIIEHYGKLDDVEESLYAMNIDFWRIHKSVLVNARYIYEKRFDHVLLANGKRLNISKECEKKLNAKYIQRLAKRLED